MFANTISLTYKTVAYVLNRVNQDNFGSEYTFLDSAQKFSLKIRHSEEAAKASSPMMGRHNVLLEHITYATLTTAEVTRTVAMTIRGPGLSDPQLMADLSAALTGWAAVPATTLAIAQGQN